jgi:hypothetical protein
MIISRLLLKEQYKTSQVSHANQLSVNHISDTQNGCIVRWCLHCRWWFDCRIDAKVLES